MAGLREPAERKTTASLCAQTTASSSCGNRSFGGQQTEDLSARGSSKTPGARQQEDDLRAAAGRPARGSRKTAGRARQQREVAAVAIRERGVPAR
jgi:hypothetical protein